MSEAGVDITDYEGADGFIIDLTPYVRLETALMNPPRES